MYALYDINAMLNPINWFETEQDANDYVMSLCDKDPSINKFDYFVEICND